MSQSTVNSDSFSQADVPVEEIDLLVVGGGKAGKSLAMLRAKAGDKVVMVERDKVGGTCIKCRLHPHQDPHLRRPGPPRGPGLGHLRRHPARAGR